MSGRKICSSVSHLVYPLKNNGTQLKFFPTDVTCWYLLSLIKSCYTILIQYKRCFIVKGHDHTASLFPLQGTEIFIELFKILFSITNNTIIFM